MQLVDTVESLSCFDDSTYASSAVGILEFICAIYQLVSYRSCSQSVLVDFDDHSICDSSETSLESDTI